MRQEIRNLVNFFAVTHKYIITRPLSVILILVKFEIFEIMGDMKSEILQLLSLKLLRIH